MCYSVCEAYVSFCSTFPVWEPFRVVVKQFVIMGEYVLEGSFNEFPVFRKFVGLDGWVVVTSSLFWTNCHRATLVVSTEASTCTYCNGDTPAASLSTLLSCVAPKTMILLLLMMMTILWSLVLILRDMCRT